MYSVFCLAFEALFLQPSLIHVTVFLCHEAYHANFANNLADKQQLYSLDHHSIRLWGTLLFFEYPLTALTSFLTFLMKCQMVKVYDKNVFRT